MPLFGDMGRLGSFVRSFAAKASAAAAQRQRQLQEETRAAVMESVAECFLYQRDPDGTPWPARLTIYGNSRDMNPLLYDLLSYMSFVIEARGNSFAIVVKNSKYYAFFHLKPYKRRPARAFLPSGNTPVSLRRRLELAGLRAARGLLGGLAGQQEQAIVHIGFGRIGEGR